MESIPVQIGRYVVESLVGAGGMGQIYKAHDPDIRRTVAIKLISTRLMSGVDRGEYIRRFRREAEAAAAAPIRTSFRSTTTPRTRDSRSWPWSLSTARACAR